MFLFILHCLGNSTNIYDFKCAATEKRKIFSFFFCIGCYLLPLPPSLILHLVILILYMFAFCCMCACVFHLVVCFVFGSFVFAVCISVGRSFNYLEMYTHASYICIYIRGRKKRKKKTIRGALLPSADQNDAHFLNSVNTSNKEEKEKKRNLLSLSFNSISHLDAVYLLAALILVNLSICIYILCLFFQTIN